jgi:dTDP-4-amino-4,6-dideoxygalactose transaminase
MSLPMSPFLSEEEQIFIANSLRKVLW